MGEFLFAGNRFRPPGRESRYTTGVRMALAASPLGDWWSWAAWLVLCGSFAYLIHRIPSYP
jgi:hypothetical protein